jgi:hypothetical protein
MGAAIVTPIVVVVRAMSARFPPYWRGWERSANRELRSLEAPQQKADLKSVFGSD